MCSLESFQLNALQNITGISLFKTWIIIHLFCEYILFLWELFSGRQWWIVWWTSSPPSMTRYIVLFLDQQRMLKPLLR